jgi:hypothetical protein
MSDPRPNRGVMTRSGMTRARYHKIAQLRELADMHDEGVLADEEFADAKAAVLAVNSADPEA